MCVGTFSGVTSAGMVISSALEGTCHQTQAQKSETVIKTSAKNNFDHFQ